MSFIERFVLGSLVCGIFSSATFADAILLENFATDPVTGGRATVSGNAGRFIYNSGNMTAAYDSQLATTKMVWSLGQTLTQNNSFSFDTRFKINSMVADPNQYMEMSFGLIHSSATGWDRPGGGTGPRSDLAWDVVTFDYFPNNTFFGPPSLVPTEINSDDGSTGYYSSLNSTFGQPTYLPTGGLPVGSYLNTSVSYDASTRLLKLSLFDDSLQPLNIINSNTTNTVQFNLPVGANFAVDSYGILLWQDTYNTTSSSFTSNVDFTNISVNTTVPEPSTLLGLALLMPAVLRRKKTK